MEGSLHNFGDVSMGLGLSCAMRKIYICFKVIMARAKFVRTSITKAWSSPGDFAGSRNQRGRLERGIISWALEAPRVNAQPHA